MTTIARALSCRRAEAEAVEGIELSVGSRSSAQGLEKGATVRAKQILEVVGHEVAVKDGVDRVLELCASIDQGATVTEEVAKRVRVREPHGRKVVDAGEFGQDAGAEPAGDTLDVQADAWFTDPAARHYWVQESSIRTARDCVLTRLEWTCDRQKWAPLVTPQTAVR